MLTLLVFKHASRSCPPFLSGDSFIYHSSMYHTWWSSAVFSREHQVIHIQP
jgi:hypothetical protein